MSYQCPPILFTIYRRPETTRQVFEAIRQAKPAKLFISQEALPEGAAPEHVRAHKETRAIVTAVDWPCELKTLFFDKHQGMVEGFTKSIGWFFDHVEEGIILEDDELPDQTYFPFCAELLEKYRHDERVMSISGSNVLHYSKKFQPKESYYFLSVACVWGLATWRRAWKHYDPYVRNWPEVRDSKLLYRTLPSPAAAFYFSQKFQGYYDGKTISWDGQWMLASLAHGGSTIYPTKNLVSNIGFNMTSFHGYQSSDLWGNLAIEPIRFPLIHPTTVAVNRKWDEYGVRIRYWRANLNWFQKIKWRLKFQFPDTYLAVKRFFYRTFLPEKYALYNPKDERLFLP